MLPVSSPYLSRIVRARDAADRRDQARWRAGEHDQALTGFSRRGRVLIAGTQRQAEDRALDAAHADRREGPARWWSCRPAMSSSTG